MCMAQLTSVTTMVSAPEAAICRHLRSSIAPEMSGSLTANRPPKPQQVSCSGRGTTVAPETCSSSCRGCASMPTPRSPWQHAW